MANQTLQHPSIFKRLSKIFWTSIFFFALLILIGVNLYYSNIFGETCGEIHPAIFEIQANIVDDNGRLIAADYTQFPANQADIELFFEIASDFDVSPDEAPVSTDLDTYLRIYDETGQTLLAANDDASSDTLSSRIQNFGLPNGGTIIVEVATYSDVSEGEYTLTVEPVSGLSVTPMDDSSNRIENIFVIEDPLDNTGDTVFDSIFFNERVAYTMTLEPNQAYDFTLMGQSGVALMQESELDTYLRVYDSSGEILLAENDDGDGVASYIANFGVDETQTVIIEVGTFFDALAGDFLLDVIPVNRDYTSDNFQADDITAIDIVDTGLQLDNDGDSVEASIEIEQRIRYTLRAQGGQAYEIFVFGVNAFTNEDVDSLQSSRLPNFARLYKLSRDPNASNEWPSCLQYFGFVGDSGYVINLNGFIWFLAGTEAEGKLVDTCDTSEETSTREFLEQCVQATIRLSSTGRMIFFVLLAIIVVSLPIFIVDSLEGQRESVWYMFLMLVVVQATTTAMLFLHLGQVSGIGALEEFGYGIFGGITTGAALVFIDKVAERAKDHTSMIIPPDDETPDE